MRYFLYTKRADQKEWQLVGLYNKTDLFYKVINNYLENRYLVEIIPAI